MRQENRSTLPRKLGLRRVLIVWLKSRASPNESFSRLRGAKGWPKSAAKDALAHASGLIAAGLNVERKLAG
jgi:hypothetical protein